MAMRPNIKIKRGMLGSIIWVPLFVLATSCSDTTVTVPSDPSQDQAPSLKIGYILKNEAPLESGTVTASGLVWLPSEWRFRTLLLTTIANNPKGGVARIEIKVIETSNNQIVTQAVNTQKPDTNNKVDTTLRLIGHNGNGGPGPDAIEVQLKNPVQLVEVRAENFHGQTTTLSVRFAAADPPPRITSFTAEPNNGYINVGESATLRWAIENCTLGCAVTLVGKDGWQYANLTLNAQGLPRSGIFVVRPTRSTFTKYFLQARTQFGLDAKDTTVQLYASPGGGGNHRAFWFKITGSTVTPCFTLSVQAPDQATAKKIAESQTGYTATSITEQEFLNGCS
jgi:hypothetical protein